MIRRSAIAFLPALVLLAGCVTISVYFPAARIQSLTEQIEAEVQRKGLEPQPGALPEAPYWPASY